MKIKLIKATIEQKSILANLLEMYAYDFSEKWKFDIGDDGFYGYEYLPLYWIEPTRFPYIIYVNDKIAGLVLVQKEISTSGMDTWDIAEFFIMRKYRRQGIGKRVAFKIWRAFKGFWQVRVLVGNREANLFWLKSIKKFYYKMPDKSEVEIGLFINLNLNLDILNWIRWLL